MQLLHIDSSISGRSSVSRELSASVTSRLKVVIPGLEVTYRDLAATPLPEHSEAIQQLKAQALTGDSDERSATNSGAQRDAAAHQTALAEFLAADIVVIGAPMYNFGIPSQLKSWIDSISVAGKTFSYSAPGVAGLCGGKRIIVASSRGGIYTGSSPLAPLDHQETYLSSVFGFFGVTDISFVRAEGVNFGPEQRERSLSSALAEVATLQASSAGSEHTAAALPA